MVVLPSGELSHFAMERSSPIFMGKSTISTGPFSIAMLVHQRVTLGSSTLFHRGFLISSDWKKNDKFSQNWTDMFSWRCFVEISDPIVELWRLWHQTNLGFFPFSRTEKTGFHQFQFYTREFFIITSQQRDAMMNTSSTKRPVSGGVVYIIRETGWIIHTFIDSFLFHGTSIHHYI